MKGIGVGVVLGLGLVTALYVRGETWRRRAVESALRADSIEAVLDTSRTYLSGELALSERRAVQLRILNDSLSKALKRSASSRAVIRITPRVVDTVLLVEAARDTTPATLTTYSEPYTIGLSLTPAPRDTTRVRIAIRSDAARLVVTNQCGEPRNGVRPATIAITTPRWLPAVIDTAQTQQVVCNDRILERLKHGWTYHAARAAGVTLLVLGGLALVFR